MIAKKERFKLIPSVYGFFIRDGKIILSRRFQTGFEDGNYSLPAGHADGGETMRQALIREVSEEVGVKVSENDLHLVVTMHRWCGDHERVDFFFTVGKWAGELRNMEPNKCDDLSWFSQNQLPSNTVPYIRAAIECYVKGEKYCEFGWENKKATC